MEPQLPYRALERISPQLGTPYVNFGRPSVPREQLLRALLLQLLYTIRNLTKVLCFMTQQIREQPECGTGR